MEKITSRIAFIMLTAAPGCFSGMQARAQDDAGPYRMELVVEGTALPVWHHDGRAWVEGRKGQRYSIRIYNNSSRRVEAVISVDGRDVIDGETVSLSKRGYIVPPWSSIDIEGFRFNWNEVAAFRFTDARNSYAVCMGSPWGVGVVATALFPEKTHCRPWPSQPLKTPRSGCYNCGSHSAESSPIFPRQNLGTEFAEPRHSPASEAVFERENFHHPAARLAIYYDDRQSLCEKGVYPACHPWWPPPSPPYIPPKPWPPCELPRQFTHPPPGWEHFSRWF